MKSLEILISSYFPNEKIISKHIARITQTTISKAGRLPLSAGITFFLFPQTIIETDKKIYIDYRSNVLGSALFSIFIGPVLFAAFVYFTYFLLLHIPTPEILLIVATILPILVGLMNLILAQNYSNIYIFRNEWISDKQNVNNKITISGIIPQNENYNFIYEIPHTQIDTIPFFDKLSSGLFNIKIIKQSNILSTNFTFQYKI